MRTGQRLAHELLQVVVFLAVIGMKGIAREVDAVLLRQDFLGNLVAPDHGTGLVEN